MKKISSILLIFMFSFILSSCNKDDKKIDEALKNVSITYASGETKDTVKSDITLSSVSLKDATVTWTSTDESVIKIEGNTAKVTRPSDADKEVTLKITIKLNKKSSSKSFTVKVLKAEAPVIEEVTVNFDSKGGTTISPLTIDKGSVVNKPADPIRAGYVFKHWSLNDGGEEYVFTTPVTTNITLYAVWEEDKVTVTFDTQGGTVVEPVSVVKGNSLTAPTTVPTKIGHTFLHWSETINGETAFDFTTAINEPKTLYAVWQTNEYTVTFKDGEIIVSTLTNVKYDTTVTTPTAPEKTGHTFDGWFNGDIQFTNETKVTESIELVAKYSPIPYTVTFKDGETELFVQTVNYNNLASFTAPEKTDLIFVNWVDEEGLIFNLSTPITRNIILNAVYESVGLPASFVATGGLGISPEDVGEHSQLVYIEFKLVDSNNEQIDLSNGENGITKITSNFNGELKELTINADSTLWFNVESEEGIRTYRVYTKLGEIYTATIDFSDIVKEATLVDSNEQPMYNETLEKNYVKHSLMFEETFIPLNTATVDFAARLEPNGKWVAPLVTPEGEHIWVDASRETSTIGYIFRTLDGTIYMAKADWTKRVLVTYDENQVFVKENSILNLAKPIKEGFRFKGWKLGEDIILNDYVVTDDIVLVSEWEEHNPEISTAEELYEMVTNGEDYSYYLINDIDLTGYEWIFGSSTFSGVFDGRGFTIKNLTASNPDVGTTYSGIFHSLNGATIKNLKLDNINFTHAENSSTNSRAGILAGDISGEGTIIENIIITNSSVSAYRYAAGLIGRIRGGATISNISITNTTTTSTNNYGGGVTGDLESVSNVSFSDIYLQMTINASELVGGISGRVRSSGLYTVERAYLNVNIPSGNAAAISGDGSSNLTVSNSIFTGSFAAIVRGSGTILSNVYYYGGTLTATGVIALTETPNETKWDEILSDFTNSGNWIYYENDMKLLSSLDIELIEVTLVFGHEIENYVYKTIAGKTLINVYIPKIEDYTFDNWYTDSEYTNVYNNELINADTVLYAKYNPNVYYTVTLKVEGKEDEVFNKVLENTVFSKPEIDPTKDNFTFDGWFEPESDEPFDFTTEINRNIILVAKFTENPYRIVKFVLDGSPFGEDQKVYLGNTVTEVSVEEIEGKIFQGWKYDNSIFLFTTIITEEYPDEITITGSYYTITENTIYVTFKLSEDESLIFPYEKGTPIEEIAGPEKEDYEFIGWFIPEATEEFIFETGSETDVTLEPRYEKVVFSIEFYNGDTFLKAIKVAKNGTINTNDLPTGVTKPGFEFGFWTTDIEGLNEFILTTPIVSDFSLYASFKELTFGPEYIAITTPTEFVAAMTSENKTGKYYLANDLDLSSITSWTAKKFFGILDGNNKTISNLKASGGDRYGLFSYLDGGSSVIKNLTIENFEITSSGRAGLIAGDSKGATISNITVINSKVSGNNSNGVGGLIGLASNGTNLIDNINIYNISISNQNTASGGVVGRTNVPTTITNLQLINSKDSTNAQVLISGNGRVGGIVGYANDGLLTIENAYVDVYVKSTDKENALLVGRNDVATTTINNVVLTGTLEVSNNDKGHITSKTPTLTTNIYGFDINVVGDNTNLNSFVIPSTNIVNIEDINNKSWWDTKLVSFSATESLWTWDTELLRYVLK